MNWDRQADIEKHRVAEHRILQKIISEQKPYILRQPKFEKNKIPALDILTVFNLNIEMLFLIFLRIIILETTLFALFSTLYLSVLGITMPSLKSILTCPH